MGNLLEKINTFEVLDCVPYGVMIHKLDTTIEYANKTALEILKLEKEDILGQKITKDEWKILDEFGINLDFEKFPLNHTIKTKEDLEEIVLGISIKNSSDIIWIMANTSIHKNDYVMLTFSDISLHHNILFKKVVDKATDIVVITSAYPLDSPDGPKIEYVNDTFCKLTGYTKEEAIGQTPRILQRDDIDKKALKRIKDALIKHEPVRETLKNYSKDGRGYWLDLSIFPLYDYHNKVTHFAAIEKDITEIKHSELSHKTEARTDLLTKLLNRRGFEISVKKLFSREKILIYSILLIDIDHFKKVNDNYGHTLGDEVLKKISRMIKGICRKDDISCRMGGEEFLIFLPNIDDAVSLKIAKRLKDKVENQIFSFQDISLKITISLGISQAKKVSELKKCIEQSDLALYKAKELGRNRIYIKNI